MPHEFTTERRVEFAETDMAGIAHFSNFFRWMESAEHEFFRSLGLSVHGEDDGRSYGFARVHASCDYSRPVRYGDRIEIHLTVRKKTAKGFGYDFVFRSGEAGEVARGRVEVVCVAMGADGLCATDFPADIERAVEIAP